MQPQDKIYVSWKRVEEAIVMGELRLKLYRRPKGIIALARGGLVPAVMLAHALDLSRIHSISVQSYVGMVKTDGKHICGELPQEVLDAGGEDWLIVDDICDTGESLREVKRMVPDALSFCIYYKRGAVISPDFWCFTAMPNKWIVFPWEKQDA